MAMKMFSSSNANARNRKLLNCSSDSTKAKECKLNAIPQFKFHFSLEPI